MSLQVVVPGTFRLVFHFMHHKVQGYAVGVGPVDVIALGKPQQRAAHRRQNGNGILAGV